MSTRRYANAPGRLMWRSLIWAINIEVSSFSCLRRSRQFLLIAAALASALTYRFISVAPVRGGTYFSLQRQRKVGKRKPLQTSGAGQDNATVHGL
ncbi:hypothetical protein PSAB6_420014 [Paraburkholderia sabiae]|nr:hypothetical protein PSAB6_420014 [Paraburkholderia sabiae]